MKLQSKPVRFVKRKELKFMVDEKTKIVLDICDIKSDMVKSILSKKDYEKISNDDMERFINYLNVIVKTNKSKNNLNNRIQGLYNLINDYYKEYKKINQVITKN